MEKLICIDKDVVTEQGEEIMTEQTITEQTINNKETITEPIKEVKESSIKQDYVKDIIEKSPKLTQGDKNFINTENSNTEENIFTVYLANNTFKTEADFTKEIELQKLSIDKNFLKIAKVIITYKEKYAFDGRKWTEMYKHLLDEVQIKRTQADKYIAVYNYCYEKYQKKQSTENMLKLGIEKLYLVSMLEDKTMQEKLEEFITVKKLSVKELTGIIKLQNNKSKIFKLSEEFNTFKNQK